jgi:hypothetical protein
MIHGNRFLRFLFYCRSFEPAIDSASTASQITNAITKGIMRKFFIIVCFVATVFDGITSMFGFCVAAKIRTVPGYAFALVGALLVIALTLSARDVWSKPDVFYKCLRPFWCLALLVNIGTVILAGCNHIILERPLTESTTFDWQQVRSAGLLERATILILTIFLTGAPIVVSYTWNKFFEDDEEEMPERKPREKVVA